MGTVNFDTIVTKDVNLDKDVTLNVTKNVSSDVTVTGNLATAEASADAIGGGSGGPNGGGIFIIDDFNGSADPDLVPPLVANQEVVDTSPDDVPEGPLVTIIDATGSGEEPCAPNGGDGPNWVMNVAGGRPGWERSIEANLGDGDALRTQICYDCDAGHLVSDPGDSAGVSTFIYQGSPINVFEELGCDDIAAVTFLYAADLPPEADFPPGTDVTFTFTGGGATITVMADDLLNTGGTGPDDYESVMLAIDDANEDIVFGALTSVTIDVDGDDVPNLDFNIDCVGLVCEGEGGGNLAETDTFAQVTDTGAFSFSESLAASSPDPDPILA